MYHKKRNILTVKELIIVFNLGVKILQHKRKTSALDASGFLSCAFSDFSLVSALAVRPSAEDVSSCTYIL